MYARIDMGDEQTAIVTGFYFDSFITRDAGESWALMDFGENSYPFGGVCMTGPETAFVCSGSTIILRTDDTGETWEPQTDISGHFLTKLEDNGAGVIAAVGRGDQVAWCHDGHNWQGPPVQQTETINAADFTPAGQGFAVGENGQILFSDNNGIAWTPAGNGQSISLYSVVMMKPGGVV